MCVYVRVVCMCVSLFPELLSYMDVNAPALFLKWRWWDRGIKDNHMEECQNIVHGAYFHFKIALAYDMSS